MDTKVVNNKKLAAELTTEIIKNIYSNMNIGYGDTIAKEYETIFNKIFELINQ